MSFLSQLLTTPDAGAISQPSALATRGCYSARLTSDETTRRDAFRLRYDSYVDQGYLDPNPDQMFCDRYDQLPSARTVVVYDHLGPVGSVRVCLLGGEGQRSPATESFPAEVARVLDGLGRGQRAGEITRLVRSPAAANDQGLVFLLYRLANFIGFAEEVRVPLASVRRNHSVFYRRLGFTSKSEPRPYPGLTCPMELMVCDRDAYERSFVRFPLIDPFAPGADCLDDLLRGEAVQVSLFPRGAAQQSASRLDPASGGAPGRA